MHEPITFDEGSWPLMVIRFSGSPTDEQFQAYLDRYERYLEKDQRYALVLVTEPNAPMTKSKHARMQAAWINEHYSRLGERCLGLAFVLPSPMMRGVLKAILSMQRLPVDYAVHGTEAEGREWANNQLIAAGIPGTGTG